MRRMEMKKMEALDTRVYAGEGERWMNRGEQWDRRYVSSLIDIANDYLGRGQLDLAEQFMNEARNYDNGKYEKHIEAIALGLEIGRAFEAYDKERVQ